MQYFIDEFFIGTIFPFSRNATFNKKLLLYFFFIIIKRVDKSISIWTKTVIAQSSPPSHFHIGH